MKCKHENVINAWRFIETQWGCMAMLLRRCTDCNVLRPVGPARDDGPHAEAVAIEIRAAELEAAWNPVDGVVNILSDAEHDGWCDRDLPSLSVAYHAGYLAYHLLCGHDDETNPIVIDTEDDEP